MRVQGKENLIRARLSSLNIDEISVGWDFNPAEEHASSLWSSVSVCLLQSVVRARLQPCRNRSKIAAASAAEGLGLGFHALNSSPEALASISFATF
jgi:hypothetical protein